MRLDLIAWTPEAEKLCAQAARLCNQAISLQDLSQIDEGKAKDLLSRVIASGHQSILEHASFTFAVEGLSRVCSHQLVRHRLASYSQQSQRHVKVEEASFAIPPRIKRDAETRAIFNDALTQSYQAYQSLIERGVSVEDARYVLPQASESRIIFTMNARELWHFFELRCCQKAQWEIRILAFAALKKVQSVAPALFENAGPFCFHGDCPEKEYLCWRPQSAFFLEKKELTLSRLEENGLKFEVLRLKEYPTNSAKLPALLGCLPEQIIWVRVGTLADQRIICLSAHPQDFIRKVSQTMGEISIWPEDKVRKITGFAADFLPPIPLKEEVPLFLDADLFKERQLFFSLASPWFWGKIDAQQLNILSRAYQEVKCL